MFVSVVLYGDEVCPSVEPLFPQWSQMFEDLIGVFYGFTLLADYFVVLLRAQLSLKCGAFMLAYIV